MDISKHGGSPNSASILLASPSPKPSTFSASMLTPSEIEWLRHDKQQAVDLFAWMAEQDERLTALTDSERVSA